MNTTISALGVTTTPPQPKLARSTPLSQKLNKSLQISLESTDIRYALDALASSYPENTPNAQRNLRRNIEKELLRVNESFVDAFGELNQVNYSSFSLFFICFF